MTPIPEGLLAAVAQPQGALALVIGAGSSIEPPTEIPAGGAMSLAAHTQLLRNGVLEEGECEHPDDLAALASLVRQKTGHQRALVRQLPIDHLRTPAANAGHKALVALMAERAVSHVLSLNFDLAVQAAASELGIRTIKFISTPSELVPADPTLVHLHRNAYADPEDLILTVEALTDEWKEGWEQVVAHDILAAPNVLFIGLGAPAPVLSETVDMITTAVGNGKTYYQADRVAHDESAFAACLGIAGDHFVQGTWCEVMEALAQRLLEEQVDQIVISGRTVLADNGAAAEAIERFETLANRLRGKSLLMLGLMRSQCRLRLARYTPHAGFDDDLWAEPMSELASACAEHDLTADPVASGLWKVMQGARLIATIVITSGGGSNSVVALEPKIRALSAAIAEASGGGPDVVLIGGVLAGPIDTTPPSDIIAGEPTADLIGGPQHSETVLVTDAVLAARLGALANA